MSGGIQSTQAPFLEAIKQNAGMTIALGIILLLLGIMAMASPLVAGLSVAMLVGIMLVIGGLAQVVFAIKAGKGVLAMLVGILTVILGGYMLANLGTALASLTIFLAIYLIVTGMMEAVMAFQIKPAQGWGWALFSGIVSVILGGMIWGQYPLSGAWAVGILLGVKLFFSGWMLLMFGLAARGAVKEITDPV